VSGAGSTVCRRVTQIGVRLTAGLGRMAVGADRALEQAQSMELFAGYQNGEKERVVLALMRDPFANSITEIARDMWKGTRRNQTLTRHFREAGNGVAFGAVVEVGAYCAERGGIGRLHVRRTDEVIQ